MLYMEEKADNNMVDSVAEDTKIKETEGMYEEQTQELEAASYYQPESPQQLQELQQLHVLQEPSDLSPSHSSVSAKTNNEDNEEDNNNSQLEPQVNDGGGGSGSVLQGDASTPGNDGLGRNRRVRQKNRYFEDFHCMNLKKGARSKDDYDVFSPSASATRSSNRRSTTENSRRDLLDTSATSTTTNNNNTNINNNNGDPDVDSAIATDLAELGNFNLRHCNKCYKKTPHDLDRKCQACLYKKIVSSSQRQKTRKLKAALASSTRSTDDGTSLADGISSACKQDNNLNNSGDGEQSVATSASSSVAHTPTPSLDGSTTSGGKSKRKATSNGGGRASKAAKQAVLATLPTLHDTDETDFAKSVETREPGNHISPQPNAHGDTTTATNKQQQHSGNSSSSTNQSVKQQEDNQHNNSLTSSNYCSDDTIISSIISTDPSNPPETSPAKGCPDDSGSKNQHNNASANNANNNKQSSSTLKLTTTLKTDDKGKKRWVVKSNTNNILTSDESENNSQAAASSCAAGPEKSSALRDELHKQIVKQTKEDIPNEDNNNRESGGRTDENVISHEPSSDINKSAPVDKSCCNISNNNNSNNSNQNNIDDFHEQQPRLTQLDAWTPEQVAQYVSSKGFLDESELFKLQAVDGMSLLLMKRTDFTYGLKMKLGPALKLFDHVCKLKREYFTLTATAS